MTLHAIPPRGRFPWDELRQPGDSFFIPGDPRMLHNAGLRMVPKRRGYKVRVKTAVEAGVAGVRVWRLP
jgi:hypothetical protein